MNLSRVTHVSKENVTNVYTVALIKTRHKKIINVTLGLYTKQNQS